MGKQVILKSNKYCNIYSYISILFRSVIENKPIENIILTLHYYQIGI